MTTARDLFPDGLRNPHAMENTRRKCLSASVNDWTTIPR